MSSLFQFGHEQNSTTQTPQKTGEIKSYLELWRNSIVLAAGYGAAALLLLGWGYIILPRQGLYLLIWWPLALAGICVGGRLFWKQLRKAKADIHSQRQLERKRFTFPLGLIFILALGLAVNIFILFSYPQELRFDSYEYSRIAFDYTQKGYTPDAIRSPGYTVPLAALYEVLGGNAPDRDKLFGPPVTPNLNLRVATIFQTLMLSLTALITYGLVAELGENGGKLRYKQVYFGNPLALVTAGLVALCPFLIAYTTVTLTEITATFWLTLSVYMWVKAIKYQELIIYPIFTGVALAQALETRPTFIYLPLIVFATHIFFSKRLWRLWQPLLVATPLVLFLLPQSAANLQTWDDPNPIIASDLSTYQTFVGIYYVAYGGLRYQKITTDYNQYPDTDPDWNRSKGYLPLQMGQKDNRILSDVERKAAAQVESEYFKNYFSNYVKSHPLEFAQNLGKRLWYMWNQNYPFPYYDPAYYDYRWFTDNLNLFYLIFGLVGIFVAAWRWKRHAWPLYLTLAYLVGVNSLVRIEFRYTIPAYPILLVFAALGLIEFLKSLLLIISRRKSHLAILVGSLAAFVLIVTLAIALPVIPATNATREKALDMVAQADDLAGDRQFDKAISLYNQAVTTYPAEFTVWSSRANFLSDRLKFEVAIPDFNKAIELKPDNPNLYLWRGEVFQAFGMMTEAVADYEKGLQVAPTNYPDRPKLEQKLKEAKASLQKK